MHAATQFDEDTAVEAIGAATFVAHASTAWSVGRGPNGGFLAALILRALTQTVDNEDRPPRTLTVQYLAPAGESALLIATAVERASASTTMLSARVTQGERTLALALATFATAGESPDFSEARMPDVPPPEEPASAERSIQTTAYGPFPAFTQNYMYRPAIGDLPYSGSPHARVGGWLRLAEPRQADALAVAAYTDAWFPAVLPRLTQPAVVPTIDLTIHFRTRLPLPDARPEDFYLGVFASRMADEGYCVEDGEIWSRSGRLIAESRQLAQVHPLRPMRG
jgi:acyl-CoA thioesterase